jgi:hypothetical protein
MLEAAAPQIFARSGHSVQVDTGRFAQLFSCVRVRPVA